MRNGKKDHVKTDGQRVREKWLLKINIERKGEAKMRTRERTGQIQFTARFFFFFSCLPNADTICSRGSNGSLLTLSLSFLANDTYKQPYKQTNGRDKVSDDGAGGDSIC